MERFIAYFDYLGFKQFIENNDLKYQIQYIKNNFRDMESALGQGKLKKSSHGFVSDLSEHRINCINFSDTIVFWSNDNTMNSLNEFLKVVYKFNRETTLTFFPARGALVYGELEYEEFFKKNEVGGIYNINSVFGKGLVKAHEKAESQQWSGTVIDTSIINEIEARGLNPHDILESYAKTYRVPYKKEIQSNEEYALKLANVDLNPVHFDNLAKYIQTNFAFHKKDVSHPDVQEKIKNTIEFLSTFKSKTSFSQGDYAELIKLFTKSKLNQFYTRIIERALYVKKHTESDEKIIPALMKTLTDKVGKTSLQITKKNDIITLVETLYTLLISIDIKEVYDTDI